jgi:hypothetical protein
MKTFTIQNTETGWIKADMTAQEVKEFCFKKLSRNNFNAICLVDYTITDEQTSERFPLSNWKI